MAVEDTIHGCSHVDCISGRHLPPLGATHADVGYQVMKDVPFPCLVQSFCFLTCAGSGLAGCQLRFSFGTIE
eukprot:m.429439 g.429439  ORF g.429439 m.429439 type:complete len:72 (-) comp56718_c0_seq2:24-239(-)